MNGSPIACSIINFNKLSNHVSKADELNVFQSGQVAITFPPGFVTLTISSKTAGQTLIEHNILLV